MKDRPFIAELSERREKTIMIPCSLKLLKKQTSLHTHLETQPSAHCLDFQQWSLSEIVALVFQAQHLHNYLKISSHSLYRGPHRNTAWNDFQVIRHLISAELCHFSPRISMSHPLLSPEAAFKVVGSSHGMHLGMHLHFLLHLARPAVTSWAAFWSSAALLC